MNEYISLHLHTCLSIGDSIITVDKLIEKAKELKLKSLAITNHGSMIDVYEFYIKCKENDIKPILGCEVYVKDDTCNSERNHLVLIAKNTEGFFDLIKIHNKSQLENFYKKPIVLDEDLKKYGKNLICLSACVGGSIPQAILRISNAEDEEIIKQDHDFILKTISNYKNYFSDFYLELQYGSFEEQITVNEALLEYAELTNTKYLYTNDVHYLNKQDYLIHNVHVAAHLKKDVTQLIYPDTCYYLLDNLEAQKAINKTIYNNSLSTIHDIINSICDYNIIPDDIYMPKYLDLPKGYTEDSYLKHISFKALDKLILDNYIDDPSEYTTRLLYELRVLSLLGFSGYFLVVMDYCKYADNNDIERGPGRGSICGLT